jgi:hypothetical protein
VGAAQRRRPQRHVPGADVFGERRAPINGEANAQNAIRDLVLQAYADFESQAAVAS